MSDSPESKQEVRFTVGVSPELAEWLEDEVKRRQASRRALIRLAILEFKMASERGQKNRGDRTGAWRKSDRLLLNIKEMGGWEISCEAAGLSIEEADELALDKEFQRKLEWARRIYAQRIEQSLLELGKEHKKFGALQKILEAKDPDYGRLKAEKIQRELGPMLKKLPQYLLAELGESHRKTIESAFEKFWADCELYLTNYTP